MNIVSLFPTALGAFEMPNRLTSDELEFILNLEQRGNTFNKTSANNYIFEKPELKRIRDFCLNSLKKYFNEIYRPTAKIEPYITQSWANFTLQGESHHVHRHPNSFISGVFYVSCGDKEQIQFQSPLPPSMFDMCPSDFNPYNSPTWWVTAEENKLYLFPSSLMHHVPEKESDKIRVSIAFNSFLKGNLGDDNGLTQLSIS